MLLKCVLSNYRCVPLRYLCTDVLQIFPVTGFCVKLISQVCGVSFVSCNTRVIFVDSYCVCAEVMPEGGFRVHVSTCTGSCTAICVQMYRRDVPLAETRSGRAASHSRRVTVFWAEKLPAGAKQLGNSQGRLISAASRFICNVYLLFVFQRELTIKTFEIRFRFTFVLFGLLLYFSVSWIVVFSEKKKR